MAEVRFPQPENLPLTDLLPGIGRIITMMEFMLSELDTALFESWEILQAKKGSNVVQSAARRLSKTKTCFVLFGLVNKIFNPFQNDFFRPRYGWYQQFCGNADQERYDARLRNCNFLYGASSNRSHGLAAAAAFDFQRLFPRMWPSKKAAHGSPKTPSS